MSKNLFYGHDSLCYMSTQGRPKLADAKCAGYVPVMCGYVPVMCRLCASCAASTGRNRFCAQEGRKRGRVGRRGLCATKRCYVQVMCQGYVPFWGVMCHFPLGLCATSVFFKNDENPSRYLCAGYVPKVAHEGKGHCPECGKHVEVVMCRLCATLLPQLGRLLCALEPERQAREALRQITASWPPYAIERSKAQLRK